jgi:hypothetical protein
MVWLLHIGDYEGLGPRHRNSPSGDEADRASGLVTAWLATHPAVYRPGVRQQARRRARPPAGRRLKGKLVPKSFPASAQRGIRTLHLDTVALCRPDLPCESPVKRPAVRKVRLDATVWESAACLVTQAPVLALFNPAAPRRAD